VTQTTDPSDRGAALPALRDYRAVVFVLNGVITESAAAGVAVSPDAVELIEALDEAGVKLAVVSARADADEVLRSAGLLDRFDATVTGRDTEAGPAGKLGPDAFLEAVELLGVEPGEAAVLDDAATRIEATGAGRFGLVVGVDRAGAPDQLLASGADIAIADLTELVPGTRSGHPDVGGDDGAAVRDRLTDTSFAAVIVCLEAEPDRDQGRTLELIDPLVAELRSLSVEVLVLGGTEPVRPGGPTGELAADLLRRLEQRGIGPGLVVAVGWIPDGAGFADVARMTVVSVAHDPPPGRLPGQAIWVGGGAFGLAALLDDQIQRRRTRRPPSIDEDPSWLLVVEGDSLVMRRAHQSWLTVADGRFGTRGVLEEDGPGTLPRVVAGGVFDETPRPPKLLEGPIWTSLHLTEPLDPSRGRRVLDLRTGVLAREQPAGDAVLRTVRFSSLRRPGTMAMRAEGDVEWLYPGPALRAPMSDGTFVRHQHGSGSAATTSNHAGGAMSAAAQQRQHVGGGRRTIERIACYVGHPDGAPDGDGEDAVTLAALADAETTGFEALLAEHRAAWAERWRDAAVHIGGDPELELSVRFCLFHLMASVPTSGEAFLGARGLSGPSYSGHVFWDADVFGLPFLAATCPPAARAMLEYRIRRLPAARQLAAAGGRRGARFPWESARDGTDVTPTSARLPSGELVPIRTGHHEEHITADIAWAATQYASWSGDQEFMRGPGAPLLLDTARYWASRVRHDDVGAHIYGVTGPDEYHEPVDDNCFTNVMARWNLRRAADLAEQLGGTDPDEVARWRATADALVDGYDPSTGRYEQFAGYYGLESIVVSELAETPVAADLLFGRQRISRSQITKQPDVLMLHHMVPEEMEPGSLVPNLDFYEPRCAHGSSLSPAIHAAQMARAGRPDEALRLFRMACRLDLDDLTGTSSGGLHVATFGGVWQALAYGFAGIRPDAVALRVDPKLPSAWSELSMSLRYRGARVGLRLGHEDVEVRAEPAVAIELPGAARAEAGPDGARWRRYGDRWDVVRVSTPGGAP
jgi:HAD superfamily hydrolase (TIGR01509 family)